MSWPQLLLLILPTLNSNRMDYIGFWLKFFDVTSVAQLVSLVFLKFLSETALKLNSLVGDIEDAVSSAMNNNLRRHSSTQNSEVSTSH